MSRSGEISDDGRTSVPQANPPTPNPKVTIMKHIKALLTASKGTEEGKSPAMRLLGEVVEIWGREDPATFKNPALENTLERMQKSIERLEKVAETQQKTTNRTYAGVAAAARLTNTGQAPAYLGRNQVTSATLEARRRLRTTIVKIADKKEAAGVRAEHPERVLDKIKRAMGSKGDKVSAIRRLPSGDLELHMATVEDRIEAEKENSWTLVVAPSAVTLRRTYAVWAHGVKMANVDTTNQGKAIESLLAQNKSMHPDLRITRVAWTNSAVIAKKEHSSLIIEVPSPEMGNRLLSEGLVEGYDMKTCTLFSKECRVTQCFNCQQYGHVGRVCRNPTRCGHCAKMHGSHDCPTRDTKGSHWCAVCNVQGHEAWNFKCPKRAEQKEKARAALARRPILFVEAGEEKASRRVSATGGDRGRKRDRTGSPSEHSQDGGEAEGPPETSKERWIEIKRRMAREPSATLPRPVGRPPAKRMFERPNPTSGSQREEAL